MKKLCGSPNCSGEVNWLFNVTIYNISVIHVTAHRCAGGMKKNLYLRSQRHRHFIGSLTCPSKHRHGTNLFIRWIRHTAPLVAFYDTLMIRRTHSRLNPPGPHGGICSKEPHVVTTATRVATALTSINVYGVYIVIMTKGVTILLTSIGLL